MYMVYNLFANFRPFYRHHQAFGKVLKIYFFLKVLFKHIQLQQQINESIIAFESILVAQFPISFKIAKTPEAAQFAFHLAVIIFVI